ncbi:hypothetical protein [Hyphomicrobium sp. CS1GBMeth3]|uniref:hypothetical protein n=1 Tax=Hyphomicrobium sp. CS1GBMeth3 TaxID=1892845 RepID=UPI000931C977|nr:hypothetical protein [Hyphomicrobium sp. CS1GBMeth3]
MSRIATALVLIAASALPASAGGDWYDDGTYEIQHWRGEYRAHYGRPYRAPVDEVYIPYGAYFVDEPAYYGGSCEVEREWRRGRYRETIECDDD